MAGNNDKRIVQMQFENRDFEKNIAKSQNSLERFKKELNFDEASKGLDEFSKSMKDMHGFETLSDNIQKLTDKFTGLGNITEFVLSRVRKGLEGMGDKIISFTNSLTTVQQQAGFVKYESLNKSVQTLKAATGKEEKDIYEVLGRLTKYTDETSYDFAQGVTSISQLVSSGAASLSRAEKTVEGFYNYAAKAGADTASASHALQYSLVQTMQRGYLDWGNAKELSRLSLLTTDFKEQLLASAAALGTVTKEGDKYYVISKKSKKEKKIEVNTTNLFNESLQHQWATTKVLNDTLGKYQDTTTEFGAQAYAAAQRCTTFSDALNAWKDMLATGWMESYRTVFGDLTDAMQLFSGLCNKVSDALNTLVAARNRVLKVWKGTGGKDSLWGMLIGEFETPDQGVVNKGKKGVLDVITGFGDMVTGAFWDTVKASMTEGERAQLEMWAGNTEAIMELMRKSGKLDGLTKEELEKLEEFIGEEFGERGLLQAYLGEQFSNATKNVQDFVQRVTEWFNVTDKSTGTTRFQKLQTVIQGILTTGKLIAEVFGGLIDFVGELLGEEHFGPVIDSIITMFSSLGTSVIETEGELNKSGGIADFFHNLSEALKPITGFLSGAIIQITGFITSLIQGGDKTKGQTDTWEKVKNFFQQLGDILKSVGQPIIDSVLKIFNALFTGQKKTEDGKEHISFFQVLLDVLKPVAELLGSIIGFVGALIADFITWGKESGAFSAVWTRIKTAISLVLDVIRAAAAPFKEFFGQIATAIKDVVNNGFDAESLTRAGVKIKEAFIALFGNLKLAIGPIKEKIKTFFQKIFGSFKMEATEGMNNSGFFQSIIGWIKAGIGKIPAVFENVVTALSPNKTGTFGEKVIECIKIILSELKGVFIKFRDFFGFNNTEAVLVIAAIAGIIAIIVGIIKAVKKLGQGMSKLGSAISSFSLRQDKTETAGDKMLKIAAALGIMVIAVYALGNMPWQKAVQGLVSMGIIMLALKVFIKSVSKSIKDLDWKNLGMLALAIYSVGAAMNKMVPALKLLGEFNLQQYSQAIIGFITILTALGLFFYAVGKFDINYKRMTGIIVLAIGIWMLLKVLANLADLPLEKLKIMGIALGAIMGSLTMVGLAIRKAPKGTFRDVGLMVAAMAVLVLSLKTLANMTDGQLIQMGKGFAGLIAGLLVLALGLSLISRCIGNLKDSGMKELAFAALSMAIIVFALKPLADMNDEQLKRMGLSFGAVIAGLLILAGGLAKINKTTLGIGDMGLKSLLWAALGMWAIIMAMKPVADMEWIQLAKMGTVFAALTAGILVLVGGLRMIEKKYGGGMKKSISFAAMVALVIGMAAIVEVMKPLANMEWKQLGKMGASFAVLIAGIALAVGKIQSTSGGINKAIGTVITILALVHAITRVVNVLKPIAEMSNSRFKKILASFAVFTLGLMAAINSIQKSAGTTQSATSALLVMLGFTVSAIVLVNTIKPLADCSWGELAKIGASFIVLITGLSKAVTSTLKEETNFSSAVGTIGVIAGFVGGIWALTQVLEPLANLSWGNLAKIGVSFVVLTVGLTKATKALLKMSKEDDDDSGYSGIIKTILMMGTIAVAMVVLARSLLKVKNVKIGTILAFTVGISIMMLAMAKSAQLMSTANIKGFLLMLVGLIAGLTAIMGIIGLLGPWVLDSLSESLPKFGEAMSALGEGLKSFIGNTANVDSGKIQTCIDLIKNIAAIQVALTAENINLAVFSALTGKDIKKGDLKAFGSDVAAVGGFIADFAEQIKDSDFTNVTPAVDALNKMAEVQNSLTWENIDLAIFSALTGQNIEAGSLTSFASDILAIAPMLKTVGDYFKETNFDNFATAGKALQAVAEARQALTVQNIRLAFFKSLLGVDIEPGNLESFGKDILAVAPMLKTVGDYFKETSFDNFSKAGEALQAIADARGALTTQSIELAIFSALTGNNIDAPTLASFGEDILAVAPMLKSVGDAFAETNFDNFPKAADALNAMAGVQGKLNWQSIDLAVFSALIGHDIQKGDMEAFGKDILAAAPTLAKISDELKDTNFENVGKAGEALNAFAALQKVLSDQGIREAFANAVLDLFGSDREVETTTLTEFGEQIVELGKGLAGFASAITYVENAEGNMEHLDVDAFTAAVSAIEVIGALQAKLPDVGGVLSFLHEHQQTLPEFATGMGKLGEGLRNIYDEVYKIKDDKLPTSSEVSDLKDFIKNISDLIATFWLRKNDIENINLDDFKNQINSIIEIQTPENADKIKSMTEFLKSFAEASRELGRSVSPFSIANALEEAITDTELQERFKTIGSQLVSNVSFGITGNTTTITDAFRQVLDNASMALMSSAYRDALSLNEVLMSSFDDADNASIEEIMTALDTKIEDAGEDKQWSFQDVGYYMAAGLALGVSSGTYLIENACRIAVQRARDAAMAEANENSPSKVFAMIGGYMSEGMAIGIKDQTVIVDKAASDMVDNAISSAETAVASFASLMSQEIDANPTITPIVDLSNITSGAEYIRNAFGNEDVRLNGGVGNEYARDAIPRSGRSTGEYQGADLTKIQSSLAELGDRITNMAYKISNLQVVMDSGELVGSISSGVSKNIGRKSVYGRRRN